MALQVLPKEKCRFDIASLGEVMIRLDPGEGRIRNARSFSVWEGGGEYNVCRALHKCFGLSSAVVTSVADNEVGSLLCDLMEQGGVCLDYVVKKETDGIGRTCRNGLNFTERGFGVRSALGVSDRANTAVSKTGAAEYDFARLFGEGVRWFHTGGIYASLSEQTAQCAIQACRLAKKSGAVVSYDLNYRPSLWNGNCGLEKAREVNRAIVPYVDVLFGNEEDFSACLGIGGDFSAKGSALNREGYKKMLTCVLDSFPNLSLAASTLRSVHSASVNDWEALCASGGVVYESMRFENMQVLDRVGGGDSFASGLIYGILTGHDVQTSLNYGVCHGALCMTTPGDTSFASVREVESLMAGESARIRR